MLPRRPNLLLPPRLRGRLSPVQGLVPEGASTDKLTVFYTSGQTIVTDAVQARITCWGGGGPGGYTNYYGDTSVWWVGGGGGGGCARSLIELSPGDTLSITVGSGSNYQNRDSVVVRDNVMLVGASGGSAASGDPSFGVYAGSGGGGSGQQVWGGQNGSTANNNTGGYGRGGAAGNPGTTYTQTSNNATASAGTGDSAYYGSGGYGYNGGQTDGAPGIVVIEWNYGL